MDRPGLEVVACPPERLAEMFRLRAAVWIHEGADPAAFPDGDYRDPRDASRLRVFDRDARFESARQVRGVQHALIVIRSGPRTRGAC